MELLQTNNCGPRDSRNFRDSVWSIWSAFVRTKLHLIYFSTTVTVRSAAMRWARACISRVFPIGSASTILEAPPIWVRAWKRFYVIGRTRCYDATTYLPWNVRLTTHTIKRENLAFHTETRYPAVLHRTPQHPNVRDSIRHVTSGTGIRFAHGPCAKNYFSDKYSKPTD